MALIRFLILVTLGLCTSAWDTTKEYKYEVRSRVITGLHQVADQFSGVMLKATLIVQPKSLDRISMKLEDTVYAPVHALLSRGWSSFIRDDQLKYKRIPLGITSFDLNVNNGVVKSLKVHPGLSNWEVNFLKALASQFQLNTRATNLKKSNMNDVPNRNRSSGVFKVMEDTISGIVETIYDVAPIPHFVLQTQPHLAPILELNKGNDLIEIIKTKNLTNSLHLPSYHFGFTEETGWEPATNEMGDFLSRSSVSRAVISGSIERFVVQSSVTTDKIIIAPHLYNKQKGIVASTMNVTLRAVVPRVSNISVVNDAVEYGLAYEYYKPDRSSHKSRRSWNDESYLNDKGYKSSRNEISVNIENDSLNLSEFFESPSLDMAPILPFAPFELIQTEIGIDWTEEIKKISSRIGENIYKANRFMKQRMFFEFNTLTEIIRTLSSEQIRQTTDRVYFSYNNASHTSPSDAQQYQTWVVFRDGVAEAGTGPALVTLNDWISSGKIHGEEAAEIMAALPRTARYPTSEYMETLFVLATRDTVTSQSFLNTTAIMSFAELLRKVQSHKNVNRMYPVHSYGSLKSDNFATLKQKFLTFIAQNLEKAISEDDSSKAQAYIFALGALSDPAMVPVMSTYFEERTQISDFLRLSMITAIKSNHRNFTRLFERIYKNEGEVDEIRVAAVLQLMNSNPSIDLLQRMAEFTNYEHSKQVNSVVKSALESLAGLSGDPLARSAKAATPLLATWEYGLQYSKHYRRANNVKDQNLKYDAQLSYIESEDSTTPSSIFYSLRKNLGGFQPQKFEIKAMSSSFKQLAKLIEGQFTDDDAQIGSKNDTNSMYWSFNKINKMLNLTIDPLRNVEGNVRFSWMGGNRLFTFNNETINRLIPQWARFSGSYFREKRNFNFTKYHNQMSLRIGFPTAAGFPFWYSFDVPTVAYLGGQVQGKAHPDPNFGETSGPVPRPVTINSTSDIIMTYSSRSEGQMGFMTPFDSQVYAARLEKNVLFHVPIRLGMDLDGENDNIKMEIEPLMTDKYVQLFEYSTKAYTFHGGAVNMTRGHYGNVTLIQVRPPKRNEFSFGKDKTGFSFDVKVETQQEFLDWATIYEAIARHDALSLLLYPFEEMTLNNNNITVWLNPHDSTSQKAEMTVAYRETRDPSRLQTELGKNPTFNWIQSERFRRQNYFLWSASNGIQDGHARMVDISLDFNGRKTVEYAATAVLASSPVSQLTKMVFFMGQKSGKSANSMQQYQILLQGNVKMPKVPLMNLKKALTVDPKSELSAEIQFGEKLSSKITFQGKMSRSDSRVRYVQNRTITTQCFNEMSSGNYIQPSCRNITSRALFLDSYDIKTHFENLPESLKLFFIKSYKWARSLLYLYNSEETIVNSKTNEVRLKLNYGKTLHSVNVALDSPRIQAKFNDIPINPYIRPIVGLHPEYDVAHRLGQKLMSSRHYPVCVMDKSMATTFDNRSYPINLGQCWHVMAHKVFESTWDSKNFSILVRETGPEQKEVVFILGQNVIELKNNQVKSNGRNLDLYKGRVSNVSDTKGQLIAQIYAHISESIRIETIPSQLEIMYDGTRVKLLISNQFRGQIRGLCGTFDGEKINDFTSPRNCILRQPFEFTASYALLDSTCQSTAKELYRQSQSAQCFKRVFLHGSIEPEEVRSWGIDTNDIQSNNVGVACIDHKIKIIETDGKTCFSILPQVVCKSHCRPTSQVEKIVDFHCINDSNVAQRWVQMVKKGANPEFNQGGPNHKTTVTFPERCVAPDQ